MQYLHEGKEEGKGIRELYKQNETSTYLLKRHRVGSLKIDDFLGKEVTLALEQFEIYRNFKQDDNILLQEKLNSEREILKMVSPTNYR